MTYTLYAVVFLLVSSGPKVLLINSRGVPRHDLSDIERELAELVVSSLGEVGILGEAGARMAFLLSSAAVFATGLCFGRCSLLDMSCSSRVANFYNQIHINCGMELHIVCFRCECNKVSPRPVPM